MTLYSLECADVTLRIYSLSSLSHSRLQLTRVEFVVCCIQHRCRLVCWSQLSHRHTTRQSAWCTRANRLTPAVRCVTCV